MTKTSAAQETSDKTAVTMTDGRVLEFGKKQRLFKSADISGDAITVRLDFRNGETRSFTVPQELLLQFAAHGAVQKLGDAIAGEKDDDDAVLAVEELIDRLSKGEWTATRQAGSNTGASVLLKALVEATGKEVSVLKAWLAAKSQAEKLALRRSAQLKPIIDRLEAEKAKTSKNAVDTDSLLGEIDDIG